MTSRTPWPPPFAGSLGLVLLATLALAAVATPPVAHAADGGLTDSAVTVKWAGGNDPDLQQYQPDRANMVGDADGSGHWNDFRDLEVTVSKTQDLRDETVTVSVSGFAETSFPDYPAATNFLQVMQCWGDPLDEDFAETCQFGGWDGFTGDTRAGDTIASALGSGASTAGRDSDEFNVPFRSVVGSMSEVQQIPGPTPGAPPIWVNGIAQFFTASSSNEVPIALVDDDGSAEVPFVVQSAAAQPYLGCGDTSSQAGAGCWLVVVPRGTHSGTLQGSSQRCGSVASANNEFGMTRDAQTGSPISPNCSFWNDRVVVPLHFADPYARCEIGKAERGMVGSELAADAVSSWQSTLCSGENATAFNLSTAPGGISRQQLLTGQSDLALVSEPLAPDTIGTADPAKLEESELAYAPVANTALTIAFTAASFPRLFDAEVYHELKLTPRLLAKMLTQSYLGSVPYAVSSRVSESAEYLRHERVTTDEEWIALGNPSQTFNTLGNGAWIVPGPHGDDAIRALWEYILADSDAVAFLEGEPDPWGNTVNRYYLPPDHPDAVGGGYDLLSAPLDSFPRADQSYAPDDASRAERGIRTAIDSISMMPYSGSLTANGVRVRNADTKLTVYWDPNKFNGAGVSGDWVPAPPQLAATGQLAIGPASAAASENYLTDTATLALPSAQRSTAEDVLASKVFVDYNAETVRAAVESATLDDDGFASLDMSNLPSNAYPLTLTVNAAVDLASDNLDESARQDYAHLLEYAATAGNVVSDSRGGLPPGYVPLTSEQVAATLTLAELLRTPPEAPADETPAAPDEPEDVPPPPAAPDAADSSAGTTDTDVSSVAATDAEATAATSAPAQTAVGTTLLAGLAGALAAPFLLRRRPTG